MKVSNGIGVKNGGRIIEGGGDKQLRPLWPHGILVVSRVAVLYFERSQTNSARVVLPVYL